MASCLPAVVLSAGFIGCSRTLYQRPSGARRGRGPGRGDAYSTVILIGGVSAEQVVDCCGVDRTA